MWSKHDWVRDSLHINIAKEDLVRYWYDKIDFSGHQITLKVSQEIRITVLFGVCDLSHGKHTIYIIDFFNYYNCSLTMMRFNDFCLYHFPSCMKSANFDLPKA